MKFFVGLLTLSGLSFFTVHAAPTHIALATTADPTHYLKPLTAIFTWVDKDGIILHEYTQEIGGNQFKSASFKDHGNGTIYDPSEEEKAGAAIVDAWSTLDARSLSKRKGQQCYNTGSQIWSGAVKSYCNQLCNIRSAGYYVGSYATLFSQLVDIDVVLPNGSSAFAGMLVAMLVNYHVDRMFLSAEVCYSFCVPSLDQCGNYGAVDTIYSSGEVLGVIVIDHGSRCANDANQPFEYPTCKQK